MCNNCDRKDWTFDLGKTPGSQIPHEIVIEPLPAPIKQIRLEGCLMDPMTPRELEEWKLQEIEQKRFQKRKAAFDRAFKAWLNNPTENEYPDRDEFFD